MENPGLRTLISFLDQVRNQAPSTSPGSPEGDAEATEW